MGRPEAGDSANYGEYSTQDQDQDFTLWRRGDPRTEIPRPAYLRGADEFCRRSDDGRADVRKPDRREENQRRGRWWTEETRRPYQRGDRVRSVRPAGGDLISHVPADTRGRVVSTRADFLGRERVTVEFDNGYTEEVTPSDIEYRRWE